MSTSKLAFDKAKKVISGCTNYAQLQVAYTYLQLYFKTNPDLDGFRYLIDFYNQKMEELSEHK